jgi:hypothetical protein
VGGQSVAELGVPPMASSAHHTNMQNDCAFDLVDNPRGA